MAIKKIFTAAATTALIAIGTIQVSTAQTAQQTTPPAAVPPSPASTTVAPGFVPAPGSAVPAKALSAPGSTAPKIMPDFITMPDGTNKPLDINTISKLNEEISRKEFEQKLRDLFAVEEQQLGVTPLPAIATPPVDAVASPSEEAKPVEPPKKEFVNYRFSGVFGGMDNIRGEMIRSDGRLFKINAGTTNEAFKVHAMTTDSVDVEFCTKKSKKCSGERYKMIVGQVVVLEKSGE